MRKITRYRGDTFVVPKLVVGAEGFNQAQLLATTCKLQVRKADGTLGVTALPEHITYSVSQQALQTSKAGQLPVTYSPATWWTLSIEVVLPASLMLIPAGDYYFDYELTYPTNLVKTYGETYLKLLQDRTYE